jgi:hypothetical protein
MILIPLIVAQAQAQAKTPAELGMWVGDWKMAGTAKDTPTEPEYKLDWQLHGRLILKGHFVQIDHIWKGKRTEDHYLEILSYDPIKGAFLSSGFQSDGGGWLSTAPFNFKDKTYVENGTFTDVDGKITKFQITWIFSDDRMALSAIQECEQDGVRWTGFTVNGTKAKTPVKK